MVGKTLGHYEILEPLGAGGMGEVYRARDTTLKRDVAIKVLPEDLAADPDRLARLEREAHLLAALNHPNIATIHSLDEVEDTRFLVLELVKGESLEQRLAKGPLPTKMALDLCKQIAEALEAAHGEGIIHRDLKPANVLITPDGRAKVLDFGLAKAFEANASEGDISQSPTLTVAGTQAGVILGTAPYMSPEQVRGLPLDKRVDIWAFGCVLYEALTASRAFGRETIADTLAAIIEAEPNFGALPTATPPMVRALVKRCLRKDPDRRLHDIADARIEIEESLDDPASETTKVASAAAGGLLRFVPWVVAAGAMGLAAWAWTTRLPEVAGSYEVSIGAPVDSEFQIGTNSGNVIISPDGTKIAFVATTEEGPRLWVRSLDSDDPVALPGTEGVHYPFWSPDSTRLAFFAAAALKTIDISGGLPQTVATTRTGRGGSWGDDGTILFTPQGASTVHKVADTGGVVEVLTTLDQTPEVYAHYFAHILPGGDRFLFFARSTTAENNGIYLARTDGSSPPTRLLGSMSSGIYAPPYGGSPGHLLWVRDGSLLAQPLDLDADQLTGTAAVIATGVRVGESQRGLLASVSDNGVLAWASALAADRVVHWYNRDGVVTGELEIESGRIGGGRLSPDDSRLAFQRVREGNGDIWAYDIETGTTRAVEAGSRYAESPRWSADGRGVAYVEMSARVMLADHEGVAETRVLTDLADGFGIFVTSPDGFFLYLEPTPDGRAPVAVSIDNPGDPVFLTEGTSPPHLPRGFSPDGNWLLLTSFLSGESELYAARWIVNGGDVRLGEPWTTVSKGGFAGLARWTTSGEIIYRSDDGYLVAVPVTQTGDGLELGREQRLFAPEGDVLDVTSDGQRFVIRSAPYADGQTLRVLINWHARLRD